MDVAGGEVGDDGAGGGEEGGRTDAGAARVVSWWSAAQWRRRRSPGTGAEAAGVVGVAVEVMVATPTGA